MKPVYYLTLSIICCILMSCDTKDPGIDPIVYTVTVTPSSISLEPGQTHDLTATITPQPENTLAVTWSSGSEDIAVVSASGKVTALAEGTAVIKAEIPGGATSQCLVTVKEADPGKKYDFTIRLTPQTIQIQPGQTYTMRVAFTPSQQQEIPLLWSVSDESVATVDEEGTVRGLRSGRAVLTVSTDDGSVTATSDITVTFDAESGFRYRLFLSDKANSVYDVSRPGEFLTERALAKRSKYGIAIDEADLPVNQEYVEQLRDRGGYIISRSRWFNAVVVHCYDKEHLNYLLELPFVESSELVWSASATTSNMTARISPFSAAPLSTAGVQAAADEYYGSFWGNISPNNGQFLHDKGYKGEGVRIAVIDAAFTGHNTIKSNINLNLKGTRSFVYGNSNVAGHEHGTFVASVMGANLPGVSVGTAPEADYWFFASEVMSIEAPIEQDYWISAVEYADSVGIDIVNASLSYREMDNGYPDLKYADSDGKTWYMTRGANIAADKGMLVVVCAGNNSGWVGTCCDSPKILTVGSVDSKGEYSYFSSFGNTADGRPKPDVMALGTATSVYNPSNWKIVQENGTSYATPIICGLAACLLQAYPNLTPVDIVDIFQKAGDRADSPVLPFGYGVPDMEIAFELAAAR